MLYRLLKKSSNKLAFAKKSVTSRLPTDSGGIRGILEPFTKVFKIEQAALLESLSFFARRLCYLNLEEFTAFDMFVVIAFSIIWIAKSPLSLIQPVFSF